MSDRPFIDPSQFYDEDLDRVRRAANQRLTASIPLGAYLAAQNQNQMVKKPALRGRGASLTDLYADRPYEASGGGAGGMMNLEPQGVQPAGQGTVPERWWQDWPETYPPEGMAQGGVRRRMTLQQAYLQGRRDARRGPYGDPGDAWMIAPGDGSGGAGPPLDMPPLPETPDPKYQGLEEREGGGWQLPPARPEEALAGGGQVNKPTVLVGEGSAHPEFVIPTDPKHRARAMQLWAQLGKKLGVKGMDAGGVRAGATDPTAGAAAAPGAAPDAGVAAAAPASTVVGGQGPGGTIGGALPFSGAGAGMISAAAGSDPVSQQLGSQYASAYNSALQLNQANYANILSGYQQTAANQQSQQQALGSGYSQLAGQIGQQNTQAQIEQQRVQQLIGQGYGQLGSQVQGALGGMGSALSQQQANQQRLIGGYNDLQSGVMNTIQGVDASQRQAIQDAYAQQQGTTSQNLINSGLGNTTVQAALQRGNLFDKQKADIALSNQMAQLRAGYQSQLGLAGLDYSNQANMQNTAQMNLMSQAQAGYASQIGQAGLNAQNQFNQQNLAQSNLTAQNQMGLGLSQLAYGNQASQERVAQANQQMNWMNSVNADYPDAGAYSQLLQMRGQALEADKNRALMSQLYGQQFALGQQALSQGQRPLAPRYGGAGLGGGGGAPYAPKGNMLTTPGFSTPGNAYQPAAPFVGGSPAALGYGSGQSFQPGYSNGYTDAYGAPIPDSTFYSSSQGGQGGGSPYSTVPWATGPASGMYPSELDMPADW